RVTASMPPGSKRAPGTVADRILSLTVGGHDPARRIRRFHLLYSDALPLARTHDLHEVFTRLQDHVKLYVAETAPRLVFVHAGEGAARGLAAHGARAYPAPRHAGRASPRGVFGPRDHGSEGRGGRDSGGATGDPGCGRGLTDADESVARRADPSREAAPPRGG